jgi:hypothetical protein
MAVGTGQASVSRTALDLAAAVGRRVRKPVTDSVSDQKPQPAWKSFLGLAVGIGVVLVAAIAAINVAP